MGNPFSRPTTSSPESGNSGLDHVLRGPCTSRGDDRPCAIFGNLEALNDCLRPAGLELSEILPGRLSLAPYEAPWASRPDHDASLEHDRRPENHQDLAAVDDQGAGTVEDRRRRAVNLVQDLLGEHRCVVSVNVVGNQIDDYEEVVCIALTRSAPSLRTLSVRHASHANQKLVDCLGDAFGSMCCLEQLVWTNDILQRYPVERLLCFLQTTSTLTILDLTEVHMLPQHAERLFETLEKKSSLTTLCVSACLAFRDVEKTCELLGDYIGRVVCPLRSLTVRKSCTSYPPSLWPIVDGLRTNGELEELTIAGFFMGRWNFAIVARLLAENRSLQRLALMGTSLFDIFQATTASINRSRNYDQEGPQDFKRCLRALAAHSSLKELTVDISTFSAAKRTALFKAVHENKVLRKVNITRMRTEDVGEICGVIRKTGTEACVHLDHTYVFMDCPEAFGEHAGLIRTMVVDSSNLCDPQQFANALQLLPLCLRLTSLSLKVSNAVILDASSRCAIESFLVTTTTLRELDLTLPTTHSVSIQLQQEGHGYLLRALSLNRSLTTLFLHKMRFTDDECRLLAAVITESYTLYDFGFFVDDSGHAVLETFLRKLGPRFAENHTMLYLSHSLVQELNEYLTVQRILRRNRALVMRASQFVARVSQNKHCAEALERVYRGRSLVKKVAELAWTNETKAAAMIRDSMKGLTEMDGFMRAARVVRDKVVCRPAGGDVPRLQLDGLNQDCWRHVRQYLTLADVVDDEDY